MDRYRVTFYGRREADDIVIECFAADPEEARRIATQEAINLRLRPTRDLVNPGAMRTEEPTCPSTSPTGTGDATSAVNLNPAAALND